MSDAYASDTALLIPSYEPDDRLAPYVAELSEAGFCRIIVVDDGSGEKYLNIFNKLRDIPRVTVLTHDTNMGKGAALRTAMAYARDYCPECEFFVTADSDGQHTVKDVKRMARRLHEKQDGGLLLGTRDFSQEDVPFKSRSGNRITTIVFMLLYGQRIPDTQTGLRGFSRELLPMMLRVKGDRYEYEMNMLIDVSLSKKPITKLPIQTVYENNNENSHFRPFQDSMRIYGIMFSGFFKFISSSLLSFGVDYVLFILLNNLFKSAVPALNVTLELGFMSIIANVLMATVLARITSGVFNFYMNKRFVFADKSSIKRSFPKYLCLFIATMLLSGLFTSNLHLWFGISEGFAKILGDTVLFFVGYTVQRKWVFARRGA